MPTCTPGIGNLGWREQTLVVMGLHEQDRGSVGWSNHRDEGFHGKTSPSSQRISGLQLAHTLLAEQSFFRSSCDVPVVHIGPHFSLSAISVFLEFTP
jgi:hypothetical protein